MNTRPLLISALLLSTLAVGCMDAPPSDDNERLEPVECGDGTCAADEDSASCPQDCDVDETTCGDDTCDADEDSASCPQDCDAGPSCGDAMCNGDETFESCPQDCVCDAELPDAISTADFVGTITSDDFVSSPLTELRITEYTLTLTQSEVSYLNAVAILAQSTTMDCEVTTSSPPASCSTTVTFTDTSLAQRSSELVVSTSEPIASEECRRWVEGLTTQPEFGIACDEGVLSLPAPCPDPDNGTNQAEIRLDDGWTATLRRQ